MSARKIIFIAKTIISTIEYCSLFFPSSQNNNIIYNIISRDIRENRNFRTISPPIYYYFLFQTTFYHNSVRPVPIRSRTRRCRCAPWLYIFRHRKTIDLKTRVNVENKRTFCFADRMSSYAVCFSSSRPFGSRVIRLTTVYSNHDYIDFFLIFA